MLICCIDDIVIKISSGEIRQFGSREVTLHVLLFFVMVVTLFLFIQPDCDYGTDC